MRLIPRWAGMRRHRAAGGRLSRRAREADAVYQFLDCTFVQGGEVHSPQPGPTNFALAVASL
jgi:hypothetical protein